MCWASIFVESCPVFVKFSFTCATVVVVTVRVGDAGAAFHTTGQRTAWSCSLRTGPWVWDALSTFKRVAPNVSFTKPVRVLGANDNSCPNEVMRTGTNRETPCTDSVTRATTRVTERYRFWNGWRTELTCWNEHIIDQLYSETSWQQMIVWFGVVNRLTSSSSSLKNDLKRRPALKRPKVMIGLKSIAVNNSYPSNNLSRLRLNKTINWNGLIVIILFANNCADVYMKSSFNVAKLFNAFIAPKHTKRAFLVQIKPQILPILNSNLTRKSRPDLQLWATYNETMILLSDLMTQ